MITVALSTTASGQITLTGTSYTQDFDAIGSGLPTGWSVTTSATASTLGTDATFTETPSTWASTTDAFKNIASNNISFGSNSTAQGNDTNRAFGWKPVGANSGEVTPFRTGAVTLKLSNTIGYTNFALSLDIFQTYNTSGIQTYKLEYRIGDSGSFTQIGSDYLTKDASGDFTDYNLTQFTSVSLAALADQSSPVYIRIRGVSTSGSSNLDLIGIDNFSLTYSAVPEPSTFALLGGASALGLAALHRFRSRRVKSATKPTFSS
ncbi:MAG: PEP-CTERM sorting domain-containing protein [Opitutaceae bacterium]|jgi:hypothetical protein